jgi:CelD/BcsL family acetyltransferase involved in cellulose biosynthesis
MLTVRIIDRPEDWDALAEAWNALLAEGPMDSIFITHEWLRLWWRWFASPGDRLHVVAAFRDGELCAAIPLRLRREKIVGVPVRMLRSLSNEHTPKYGCLWRANDPQALTAALDAMHRQTDWDVLRLDYMSGTSATRPVIARFCEQNHVRAIDDWCISSPYVSIQGSWEDYLASLSHNFRSKTLRAERKLRQAGTLEVVEIRGGPALAAALREAYAVEQSSWKGEAGSAIACRPNEERFYTELAEAMSGNGWFRLFLLKIDGRPIAFYYCFDYRRTMSSVKIGYDPAFGKCSPGTVLKSLILKTLFNDHTHDTFDMLGAATDAKLRWGNEVHELRTLWMFHRGARGRIAYELQFGIKSRVDRYPRLREALRRAKARVFSESEKEVSAQE